MFERKVYWINESVDKLQQEFFPDGNVEFHAQAIHSHRSDPWKSLPSAKRIEVFQRLFGIIDDADITLFGIAVERATTEQPVARAFEELCNRFDLFLKRLHAQGNTQRGLLICDESRYEARLQTLLSEYRSQGTRFGQVKNFADVPFFADSKSTRLLQVADLVAYSIFRRYEQRDTRFLDRLIHKFDAENEVLHGLLHLTTNYEACTCPACLTRRLASRR